MAYPAEPVTIETATLAHYERLEYLKERARIIAAGMLEGVDLLEIAEDPDRFAADVLAAVLTTSSPLMDAAAESAEDFARAVEMDPVVGSAEVLRDGAKSDVIAWALPAFRAALGPVVQNVGAQLASGVDAAVVQASLASAEVQSTLLASFAAVVKRAAAELVQGIARWVLQESARALDTVARLTGLPAPKFVWLTVQDARVCKGRKEFACILRHGGVAEFTRWESLGLPGAPNLRCRRACRCFLKLHTGKEPIPERPVNIAEVIAAAKDRAQREAGVGRRPDRDTGIRVEI